MRPRSLPLFLALAACGGVEPQRDAGAPLGERASASMYPCLAASADASRDLTREDLFVQERAPSALVAYVAPERRCPRFVADFLLRGRFSVQTGAESELVVSSALAVPVDTESDCETLHLSFSAHTRLVAIARGEPRWGAWRNLGRKTFRGRWNAGPGRCELQNVGAGPSEDFLHIGTAGLASHETRVVRVNAEAVAGGGSLDVETTGSAIAGP